MAHLLLLEAPGGNDFTVLAEALRLGHKVTFFTGELAQYERQGPEIQSGMARASRIVEIRPFDYAAFEVAVLAVHDELAFDAVLCTLDIRMIEASRIAARLGLKFLNPATTGIARDKVRVREALVRHGVRQPPFALAVDIAGLPKALEQVGYPALVRPVDGYASRAVSILFSPDDLAGFMLSIEKFARDPSDLGSGAFAYNRFSVERYVRGPLVGCDVFSSGNDRVLLGINSKAVFPPPSFAMRGSTFPSTRHDTASIQEYAFQVLDAIDFDFGACHIEMIIADDGPHLVEISPRLVSAQIPHQMSYALERPIYADLIDLHLGRPLDRLRDIQPRRFAAIRWIVADRPGKLRDFDLPDTIDESICRVVIFKQPGDVVRPPLENADRIGYAIAIGETETEAEINAETYIAAVSLSIV